MSEMYDYFVDLANPRFQQHLGQTVSVTLVDQSIVGRQVSMVFNEFVGAIDERGRAIFLCPTTTYPGGNPRRGDAITINSRTFYAVDIRKDETGNYELRCDVTQEDV